MNLFSEQPDPFVNLLPQDGTLNYYGKILLPKDSDRYYDALFGSIEWRNDQAVIYGKRITTKRKVAWYGDREFEYTYSKITKKALLWTSALDELKNAVEEVTGEKFNACLLNLYHSGDEGMAWHSDAEKVLKQNGAIGSLSFGAERKFALKHKETKQTISLTLEHGSLLVMKDTIQTHWLHRLPTTKKIVTPRINLTFRMMNFPQ